MGKIKIAWRGVKMETEVLAMYKKELKQLRELFIRRMTVDSETKDRRRKDFNQAIFHIESDEDIDAWNEECEKYGLQKKKHGESYPVWSETSLDMVLACFDDAVKDFLAENNKKDVKSND